MASAGEPDHPAPTRERADRLVEKIDNGDLDPADVSIAPFVENDGDVFTPELAERLPDETVERYNEQVAQKQRQDLESERRENAIEASQAVQKLRDPESEVTGEAELLSGTPLEVKTHTNGEIDEKIAALEDADSALDVREDIIDVINWFVVDDDLSRRDVWQQYAAEYGTADLMREAMRIMEPYYDTIDEDEVIQRFRREQSGPGGPGGV